MLHDADKEDKVGTEWLQVGTGRWDQKKEGPGGKGESLASERHSSCSVGVLWMAVGGMGLGRGTMWAMQVKIRMPDYSKG